MIPWRTAFAVRSRSRRIRLDDGRKIRLTQETRYPWDGAVKITVAPEKASRFALALRIPGWARNEAISGGLYRFADTNTEAVTLQVNGKPVPLKLENGYARLDRKWKTGDVVTLDLPMPVRRVVASEKVKADIGRVALERGPIVFCAEWPDNPNGKVRNLILPEDQRLTPAFEPGLLNGVETISGKALAVSKATDGSVAKAQQDFKAIPYYAWANRGPGEMIVWLRDSDAGIQTQ